ncbi:MAG: hypothetical protein U5K84_04425 [Alkalibacterium sp.]|nr:hypothetical protein [Alkalibacterium sp.]
MQSVIGNIDPVAFRLGPIEVAWYGLIIVTGMFFSRLAEHERGQ